MRTVYFCSRDATKRKFEWMRRIIVSLPSEFRNRMPAAMPAYRWTCPVASALEENSVQIVWISTAAAATAAALSEFARNCSSARRPFRSDFAQKPTAISRKIRETIVYPMAPPVSVVFGLKAASAMNEAISRTAVLRPVTSVRSVSSRIVARRSCETLFASAGPVKSSSCSSLLASAVVSGASSASLSPNRIFSRCRPAAALVLLSSE